jgi:NTE family protein
MKPQFKNLCFEGGGVKGIAYVGAMQVLEQAGVLQDIKRVGGTSAGAINALLYAIGVTLEEQREILASLEFRNFLDDSFGYIRDINRLLDDYGIYKGDFFKGWVGDLIESKLGDREATFGDLTRRGLPDLYICATNLCSGYGEVFSYERHSHMPIATAVRMSMSIPLFFKAVKLGGDVYVDGGVQRNYPIRLFDRLNYIEGDQTAAMRGNIDSYQKHNTTFLATHPNSAPYVYNKETLGFRLDSENEIGMFRYGAQPNKRKINDIGDYLHALITAMLNTQGNTHLNGNDRHRTVYINDEGVSATDFDLSETKKADLLRSGIECTQEYLRWFNDPKSTPMNRM